MDGLCDADEAVRLAADMGHTALAITDYTVVQAFPQAMRALREVRKTHPSFVLIYGCEVVFVPDTSGPFILSEGKALPSFHMMLLARTQVGLGNLYRIIVESPRAGQEKSPRVPQVLLERYREGLLLGSVCEKGGLHQALASGCSWSRLREMAVYFDYFEVQSVYDAQNDLQDALVASRIELCRRFLALGRELNKPVAATGNAHVLCRSGATAHAVVQCAQGCADTDQRPPRFLRTTEEMLEAFAFLGEQDAFDVVVRMPNQIAGWIDPELDGSLISASELLLWHKPHCLLAFYSAFFSARESWIDYDAVLEGSQSVRLRIRRLEEKEGKTHEECDRLDALRLANEYLCRGFSFLPAELGKSRATVYEVEDGKLRLPYLAIEGVGMRAAKNLEKNAQSGQTYASLEDFRRQMGCLSHLAVDALDEAGLLCSAIG